MTVDAFDLKKTTHEQLAQDLKTIDAMVSALNGLALELKATIQGETADAGM